MKFKKGDKIEGEILHDHGNGYYLVKFGDIRRVAYSTVKLDKTCIFEVVENANIIHLKIVAEEIAKANLKKLRHEYPSIKELNNELALDIVNHLQAASMPLTENNLLDVYKIINNSEVASKIWLPLIVRLLSESSEKNMDILPALKSFCYLFNPMAELSEDAIYLL